MKYGIMLSIHRWEKALSMGAAAGGLARHWSFGCEQLFLKVSFPFLWFDFSPFNYNLLLWFFSNYFSLFVSIHEFISLVSTHFYLSDSYYEDPKCGYGVESIQVNLPQKSTY